jgi:membrane associated rhomboid family serine protease
MKISAVLTLIAANAAVYLWQLATNGHLELPLALWPLQAFEGQHLFRPWQIVTYSFLHDPNGISHLAFNMLGLWMFGAEIERYVGPGRLLACYFASVVTAALAQLFMPFISAASPGPTIGASGGVFGLLLAYAVMFPHRKVVPLIPPIPMPAGCSRPFMPCWNCFSGSRERCPASHISRIWAAWSAAPWC